MADNLRVTGAGHVFAAVLVLLRTLLVRLSVAHLTPIWPTVIAELTTVMSLIDDEAATCAHSDHKYFDGFWVISMVFRTIAVNLQKRPRRAPAQPLPLRV